MPDGTKLEHRVSAIEICLVALMVERFRSVGDPVAALDAFDDELHRAAQLSIASTIEAVRREAPEESPETIEKIVREEMEPIDMARMELCGRVRKLLLQG